MASRPEFQFRIEEENLSIVNASPLPALAWIRRMLDDCLHSGVPIIVTDERDLEIGRVTGRSGSRYVWERNG